MTCKLWKFAVLHWIKLQPWKLRAVKQATCSFIQKRSGLKIPKNRFFWIWEQYQTSGEVIFAPQTVYEQWRIWSDAPDTPLCNAVKNPLEDAEQKKVMAIFRWWTLLFLEFLNQIFKLKPALSYKLPQFAHQMKCWDKSHTLMSMSMRWTDITEQLPIYSTHLNENAFSVQGRGQNGAILTNWSDFRIQHQKLPLNTYFH